MNKENAEILEVVNFIKDHMVANMVTKDEFDEFRTEVNEHFEKVDTSLGGIVSRLGGVDNRIDNEVAQRKDLETRVRTVVPTLAVAPEYV
jgi:archaellum component FlaC